MLDIGQRVDSEAAGDLRFIRLMLDAIQEPAFVVGRSGQFLAANSLVAARFGFDAEALASEPVSTLFPDFRGQVVAKWEKDSNGETGKWEASLGGKCKSGKIFSVALTIASERFGGEPVLLCTVSNSSQRNQIDRLNHEVKNLQEGVVDGLLTFDENGTILSLNHASELIFGYDSNDVVGRNIKDLLAGASKSNHDSYIRDFHADAMSQVVGQYREVLARRADGSHFYMDLAVSHMDGDGERVYVAMVRDITDRKLAEEEKEELIKALHQSNVDLDDFAYIASHDLKEPLRGLHNNALFMIEDFEEVVDAAGKRRLERMRFLCERLEQLIDELLYFSRIGRADLAVEETDLNGLVEDVIEVLKVDPENSEVEISCDNSLPKRVCDRVRVKEVFRNLIVNGLKYNRSERKRIAIGHLDERDGVSDVFYVKDNGIGIDAAFHQDVFRIFKRLNSEPDGERGTGAGLTFVKKIVEKHQGRIWIESEPGEGSTFFFTLRPPEKAPLI